MYGLSTINKINSAAYRQAAARPASQRGPQHGGVVTTYKPLAARLADQKAKN